MRWTGRLDSKPRVQVEIVIEGRELSGGVARAVGLISMRTRATGDLQKLVYRAL